MNLGKIAFYGSLLVLPFVSPKIIEAENLPECKWDLSVQIDKDGKFNKDITEKIPCSVDKNYRNWQMKKILMTHDTPTPILRIDYKSENGTTYFEFWSIEGKLMGLIADGIYHFDGENLVGSGYKY
ncbi:hypothetical protein HYT25_01110 [Candidatus Pacearchaeota archaeon]|nr:hypothetical protein [Candidatus Pacearchaeota archaeon]